MVSGYWRISDFPLAGNPGNDDLFLGLQNGDNVKFSFEQIKQYVSGGVVPQDIGAASEEMIAVVEEGPTASESHASGDYLIWDGILYTATQSIAQGDVLAVETNISAVMVGNVLVDLKRRISTVESGLAAHEGNVSNPHAVTKAQVGLGNVDNVRQYSVSNPPPVPTPAEVGAVPTSREVNGHALSADITLTSSDVGALPNSTDLDDIPDGTTYQKTTAAQVAQIGTNESAISTIEGKIPNAASSSNQLADKAFVADSITQGTAIFRGSFASKAALLAVQWQTTDPDAANYVSNNDYAVVQDDETQNDECWRYIYVTGTGWTPQYKINETPFTQAQLDAINSGATAQIISSVSDKYVKPSGGIPKTDLASGVQTSLGAADTAYQKPSGGIPKTDLASDVKTSLGKADSALQSVPNTYRTAADQDVIDSGKLGTSGDGSDVTAAFTEAGTRANIATGEKLSVLFGKIKKWFTDLGTAAFKASTASVTENSTDLVESGAVYTELAGKADKTATVSNVTYTSGAALQKTINGSTTNVFSADASPVQNSKNPIQSGGVYTAINGVKVKAGTASLSASWSGSGPYTQTATITGATVTSNSVVDIQLTAAQMEQLIEDGVTSLIAENNAGTVVVYAFGAAPSTAMTLQITVTEVTA